MKLFKAKANLKLEICQCVVPVAPKMITEETQFQAATRRVFNDHGIEAVFESAQTKEN